MFPCPEKVSRGAGGVSTGEQRITTSTGPRQLCHGRWGTNIHQAKRKHQGSFPPTRSGTWGLTLTGSFGFPLRSPPHLSVLSLLCGPPRHLMMAPHRAHDSTGGGYWGCLWAQEGQVLQAGCGVPRGRLEDHHLPSGGRIPRLCEDVNHAPLKGCRSDRRKVEEGGERTGRGRWKRQHLALAEEERTTNPVNSHRGVTGRRPRHSSTTRTCSRIKGAKHWWAVVPGWWPCSWPTGGGVTGSNAQQEIPPTCTFIVIQIHLSWTQCFHLLVWAPTALPTSCSVVGQRGLTTTWTPYPESLRTFFFLSFLLSPFSSSCWHFLLFFYYISFFSCLCLRKCTFTHIYTVLKCSLSGRFTGFWADYRWQVTR